MVQTRASITKRKLEEVDTSAPRGNSKHSKKRQRRKHASHGTVSRKSDPASEEGDDKVDQSSDSIRPSKKRRKGNPGQLSQLNFDVLLLIAEYLHPIDLLNLARTCKSLRELLTSNAVKSVWKAARRQIEDLPDCPADLSEPQYANLVFFPRCHGCGKYAKTIHWLIRRRYCPKCRKRSLRNFSTCKDWIKEQDVLPTERLTIGHIKADWVEKGQLKSIEAEWRDASNKASFFSEKRAQVRAIERHAAECKRWEMVLVSEHNQELASRRTQRGDNIFSRLWELGFGREITFCSEYGIKCAHPSIFRTSKPLTDREWAKIWPKLQHKMDEFRSRRLEQTVYGPRRRSFTAAYDQYVAHRASSSTPAFFLPHVDDLARLSSFEDIIKADEGVETGDKPFESVFEKLPEFSDECKRLEIQLGELVEIPPQLSSSNGQTMASCKLGPTNACESAIHRLQLACAVFFPSLNYILTGYPDVLHLMRTSDFCSSNDAQDTLSRCDMKFLKDAPYIIHACGLDPNIATPEDMDRRNARLTCIACNDQYVYSWRKAMLHARISHADKEMPLESQWQLVGDEHMGAIQAAELKLCQAWSPFHTRCVLCHPRVGDAISGDPLVHLQRFHNIQRDVAQEGVHFTPVGMKHTCSCCVKMVQEGDHLTFKDARFFFHRK